MCAAKSLQSCPTLCDPTDGSPPGSPVPGILRARTLERVSISFSNAWKWKMKVKSLSRVQLVATPWTVADQAPPSMGFSRQGYWSGLPLLSLFYLVYLSVNNVEKNKSLLSFAFQSICLLFISYMNMKICFIFCPYFWLETVKVYILIKIDKHHSVMHFWNRIVS